MLIRSCSYVFLIVTSVGACVGCSGLTARSAPDLHDAQERAAEDITSAIAVLDKMPQIPDAVRQRTRCLAVAPTVDRPGTVYVGGRHGHAVVTCRVGAAWSAPVFVSLTNGSAGPSIDVDSTDLVMLVMSERAMSQLFRPTFVLGADASTAEGPVGAVGAAGNPGTAPPGATDAGAAPEVLSYGKVHGLFAGAQLGGTFVNQDRDALAAMYGTDADVPGILGGSITPPKEAAAFLAHVAAAFPLPQVASLENPKLVN
jgi:lipid-binding SYLF domain-containing protein